MQKNNFIQKAAALISPRSLPVATRWQSPSEAVWIGGCGRSGTTLLRVMLNAHPMLYGGPELNVHTNLLATFERFPFLPHRAYLLYDAVVLEELASKFDVSEAELISLRDSSHSLPEFVDRLLTKAAHEHEKQRWIEKTPKNVAHIGYLFEHFPHSKFIHVLRDGRDVACSLRHHPRFVRKNGALVATNINNPIEKCIGRWIADVNAGLKHRDDSRYLEVQYQDLVDHTERELRRICDFLGLPFDPAMLSYAATGSGKEKAEHFKPSERVLEPLDSKSIGRWKKDLSFAEACVIEARAGTLLRELGYTKDDSWVSEAHAS